MGDPTRERLVEVLARARLVTVSESSVELAHEALARAWPRLRAWLDEDASGQRIWRHLAASADGWDALGRPDSELYRGARLDATDEWLRDAGAALAPVEEAFLVASRQREHSSRLAMAEANRRQAAQNRRLRQLVIGVGALLAVALVAGFAAVDRGRTAQAEGNLARAAEKTSLHESLTSRSLALRSTNRALAALLAVEAYRQQPDDWPAPLCSARSRGRRGSWATSTSMRTSSTDRWCLTATRRSSRSTGATSPRSTSAPDG